MNSMKRTINIAQHDHVMTASRIEFNLSQTRKYTPSGIEIVGFNFIIIMHINNVNPSSWNKEREITEAERQNVEKETLKKLSHVSM